MKFLLDPLGKRDILISVLPRESLDMANDLLVKNVPPEIREWIDRETYQRKLTLKELVISLLREASKGEANSIPLFDGIVAPTRPDAGVLPFSFIDLFAGIGGIRTGLQRAGGKCVFSSEWDTSAQKTYAAWYGETPEGDITKILASDIPDHDVLAGGFPCQPFSIAGVSKKNSLGRAHGFKCQTQGTLFFHLASVIEVKRPPVFLLENVKNLKSHDKGRTWQVIEDTLTALGYVVFNRIIDAAAWVPQHRERIFIVGFDRNVFGDKPPFEFPTPPERARSFRDILEPHPDPKYTLTDHLWEYLQAYAKRHQEKGNGFGFGLADLDGVTRTLSARYYKDGSEVLIPQPGKNPRRLTPREAARLMGYDDKLPIVVSDTQAYRQFGNSVVPAVIEAVARQIVKVMAWQLARRTNGCLLKSRRKAAVAG
jgi:DNA (cytosine-5)-methyltransferase 1